MKHHNLEHSISHRGNCHDNAVAESFVNLLKRERIRRRTREEAKKDGMLSPVEFERQQEM